jgi:hypothetical protein
MALDQYNDEKKEPLPPNVDTETGTRRHFGNGDGKIGGRIAPVLPHLAGYDFGNDDSGSDILGKQIELEADHALKYRSCSWQKTAFLLFSEYSMFDRIGHHSRKENITNPLLRQSVLPLCPSHTAIQFLDSYLDLS